MNIIQLTPRVSVCSSMAAENLEIASARGVRRIMDLRSLSGSQSNALRRTASRIGVAYLNLPVPAHMVFDEAVLQRARGILDPAEAPLLIACNSGQRAAMLWAAVAVETRPFDDVIQTLADAGFDTDVLSEELQDHVLPSQSAFGGVAA